MRYCLLHGEDGDKYVVPVERREDFFAWIGSEEWENGKVPEYAKYVDGRLTFTDPRNE